MLHAIQFRSTHVCSESLISFGCNHVRNTLSSSSSLRYRPCRNHHSKQAKKLRYRPCFITANKQEKGKNEHLNGLIYYIKSSDALKGATLYKGQNIESSESIKHIFFHPVGRTVQIYTCFL